MPYSLVELIEIITQRIGDWDMEFIQKYAEDGFTARQIEYIEVINKLGNPNLGEIAKALNISKPSVTAIVDKMTEKGYIKKIQSDEDRRSFHVHLSDKGKKVVQMHDETHKKIAEFFGKNLSSKDLATLISLFNKVVSKI
ncbi:MAG: MarR family transcriptional regulator [Deltaproteobacteria bacterium]|nr:MarR family transcriptional regulator [Deltaproteobacteria bacterium]